jgi:predicted AAA+ superfamily ATPase
MNRKQLKSLANRLNAEDRKPLVIRGARQIGKSTLVRLFAQARQRPLAEINLERYPELNAVFETMNPPQILNQLEALPKMPAIDPDSLLFLDEIQAAPAAIDACRENPIPPHGPDDFHRVLGGAR